MGNLSDGNKEGIFDNGWTVVKKKKKLKSFSALSQRFREFFNGSFRAPICKSGTKSSPGLNISGPRCSQIQMGFNASPFSGPNNAGSSSAGTNVHPILNDPEVRSLERLLRVKSKVELRLPGRLLDKPPGSVSVSEVLEASAGENASVLEMSEAASALRESGSRRLAENSSEVEMLEVSSALRELRPRWLAEEVSEVSSGSRRLAENVVVSKVSEASSVTDFELVHETDGDSVRISELLEVPQLAEVGGAAESAAHATAGDSEGIIGLHVSHSSRGLPINSSNSFGCVAAVACARLPAVPGLSAAASKHLLFLLRLLLLLQMRGGRKRRESSTPMHDAHNSWSDTGRVQGPTGRRCTKGGVSSPAEDLRPVSEVEAGVNFRPAGGVRRQVAGSIPRRQPGTGTRQGKGSVVTPSLHPEVPGIQFVSPGYGLDIRQSMGWTKVCGTARSGIWVLKGNASARMFPANLDHLRVGWRKQGTYKTAWVTPGHDCLCSYAYGHGAAVRPQTNDAIWHGVIGLWGRVAPLLSPWCARREVPTGVNLNRYSGPSSCIRWHSDNEPLFGPQNAPKLIVSMSLGNSVEFKVRRRMQGEVPSLITLDHGDLLVMDGLTQSEYVHCTASGLQGPRVNLTFRWVAQHIASCPLAGAVGCVLPSCVQGLAEPGPRGEWSGENKWSSSWGLVLLLLILCPFF